MNVSISAPKTIEHPLIRLAGSTPEQGHALLAQLRAAQTVVLTTHIRPDHDGCGAGLAMLRWLRGLGKDARFFLPGTPPFGINDMLLGGEPVHIFDPDLHGEFLAQADVVVVVDVGLLYRLGGLEIPLRARCAQNGRPMLVLDHHLEIEPLFTEHWVHSSLSSTGEVVTALFELGGITPTADMAGPLFMAISEDSGHFAYERTRPETLRRAANLVEAGANPYAIHQALSYGKDVSELRFLAAVTATLRVERDAPLAWAFVSQAMLNEFGFTFDTMPSVANIPLSLKGVEASMVFVELACGETKVSIRSRGRLKVSEAAALWGGGGHMYASGFTIARPLKEAIREGVARISTWLTANLPAT